MWCVFNWVVINTNMKAGKIVPHCIFLPRMDRCFFKVGGDIVFHASAGLHMQKVFLRCNFMFVYALECRCHHVKQLRTFDIIIHMTTWMLFIYRMTHCQIENIYYSLLFLVKVNILAVQIVLNSHVCIDPLNVLKPAI